MKIFATSDIHGNKNIISKLVTAYENSKAELLLICGDIGGKSYRVSSVKEFGHRQFTDYIYLVNALAKCSMPFNCILGNDDWFEAHDVVCLKSGGRVQNIIAFDYVSLTPFNTNREANENRMEYELKKLSIGAESVIMAHCPPYGSQDKIHSGEHVGSKAVAKIIKELQPKVWLCGHIHEDFGISKIGKTLVINCACDHLRDRLRGVVFDTESLEYSIVDE